METEICTCGPARHLTRVPESDGEPAAWVCMACGTDQPGCAFCEAAAVAVEGEPVCARHFAEWSAATLTLVVGHRAGAHRAKREIDCPLCPAERVALVDDLRITKRIPRMSMAELVRGAL